jgi:hypothetical protein
MAGTPIGSIDHLIGDGIIAPGSPELNQAAFKIIFDFMQQMVTAGYATRIALQYGSTSYTPGVLNTWGTGTDFYDGATPFGEGAFAVYRMNGFTSGNTSSARNGTDLPDFDYYILIQWYDYYTWGTAPGGPAEMDSGTGSDGVGYQLAVREDGASPWNGTTNNDGTDTKGDPVWADGGSTAHVLPYENGPGKNNGTSRESCMRIFLDLYSEYDRIHCVGTADSVIFFGSDGDDGGYACSYGGIFEPTSGLSLSLPLVMLWQQSNLPFSDTQIYGDNGNYKGGLLADESLGVSRFMVGQWVAGTYNTNFIGNSEPTTPELDEYPTRIQCRDPNKIGYVGDLEIGLCGTVYHNVVQDTNAALTRAYLGSAGVSAEMRMTVAWDGSTAPGTTMSRAGVQF